MDYSLENSNKRSDPILLYVISPTLSPIFHVSSSKSPSTPCTDQCALDFLELISIISNDTTLAKEKFITTTNTFGDRHLAILQLATKEYFCIVKSSKPNLKQVKNLLKTICSRFCRYLANPLRDEFDPISNEHLKIETVNLLNTSNC